jgi:hypothetical protein
MALTLDLANFAAVPMPVTLNMGMRMPSWVRFIDLLGISTWLAAESRWMDGQYDIKSLSKVDDDSADGIETTRDLILGLIAKEVGCLDRML